MTPRVSTPIPCKRLPSLDCALYTDGAVVLFQGRPWPAVASAMMLCSGSYETYNGEAPTPDRTAMRR